MSCEKHKELKLLLDEANKEIERLQDENASLWFMLDEMRKADEAIMERISEMILEDLTPIAEA